MEALGYFCALFMGLSLGLIGSGGAILTVPILVYLFSMEPLLATVHSLFIVGVTALIGGLVYLRRGEADLKTALFFALPSYCGVYLARSMLLPWLPDPVLQTSLLKLSKAVLVMGVFSTLMIGASLSMIFGLKAKPKFDSKTNMEKRIKRGLFIASLALLVGAIAGFVGAGGGFLIIPTLVVFVGLPMRVAAGTSLLIIFTNSMLGFYGDYLLHLALRWDLIVSICLISTVGLFTGLSLSRKITDTHLRQSFGYFVLFMGIAVLSDQLRQM